MVSTNSYMFRHRTAIFGEPANTKDHWSPILFSAFVGKYTGCKMAHGVTHTHRQTLDF